MRNTPIITFQYYDKCFLIVILLICFSCTKAVKKGNNLENKSIDSSTIVQKKAGHIILYKLKMNFCIGNFDGDGIRDTIFVHNFSKLLKADIENTPDPTKNEWDDVVKWYLRQDSDLYLFINKTKKQTLHLGRAQGLYCLLNIGDANFDGKDEIAFVVDYLDFSNLNSCKIYSFCQGKWVALKQFNVNESAFDFLSAQEPLSGINNYLEKKGNQWYYRDNLQNDTKMQLLKLKKCQ